MTRMRVALFLAALALPAAAFHAQAPRPAHAFTFTQIVPGIYSALGTGAMNVGSNSAVIVNQDDVVIVDSHISPESGRAMLTELKAITDKPVKFLINTHFHYDHTNGNQVFPPAVEIIGHEYTRRRLAGDILQKGMFANLLAALPQQLDTLRTREAGEQDPAAKARLAEQLRVQTAFAQSVKDVTPTPPNVTLADHMTLYRGGREIQLMYLGRGHTGGDVVVYLPKERVLCSGDLLVNGVANLVDGYVDEWPAALEKLKALDFDNVIPGHGDPFRGKERIAQFQSYLTDFWQQASKLHDAHVAAEEAAKRMDMTAHKQDYPSITGPGVPLAGVIRVYEVIEHRAND